MSLEENETILGFISQILMDEEDDLDNNEPASMFHDPLALQATEQSLYDAINESTSNALVQPEQNQYQEEDNLDEQNNQLANGTDDDDKEEPAEQLKIHGGVLLFTNKTKSLEIKDGIEFVDLRSLLMQCAKAMSDFHSNDEVNGLMLQIRRHSSPHGNATQRVAHYFVNALEARLAGTGNALLSSVNPRRISGSEILKGNKMFIKAVPFPTMTNLLTNGTVMKYLAKKGGAATLHIIDLGIMLGFQWPSLILALSELPRGPPMLRITGIDFPQPGIRPDERVLETGARLEEYCERFGVPFEFNAIAQEWDTIGLEDLKIEKSEFVVVNSLNRLHFLMDQEDVVSRKVPRDELLKFIRKINPEMFIHGVTNGTHNMPFFVSRFRAAFYHFSSLFDMFEATVSPEEEDEQSARVGFEEHMHGRSIMSIVACEGTYRMDRPETYKQWQCRTVRAGFRQISLDKKIVKRVKKMIKEDYHEGFSMAKDGKWILLEWKGRVFHAISCWRPIDS